MPGHAKPSLRLRPSHLLCGALLLGFANASHSLTDGFEVEGSNLLPTPVIACTVDTSARNELTTNACISLEYGGSRKSSASFHVLNINPDEYQFNWSTPSCEGHHCTREITAYRTLTVDVAVTHKDTGQEWYLSAEAIYENGY